MSSAAKRYALFDLDGTLLDTEPAHTAAIDAVLAPYGKRLTLELKRRMMGRATPEAAEILINALALPLSADEYVARRDPLLWQLTARAEEIAGAAAFVGNLAARGVTMGVATSSPLALTRNKLCNHAMKEHFRAMVCGDDERLSRSKPAPDIFLEAARRMGADPAQTVVFEDSESGVAAARAAGMDVVVIADPVFGLQEVPEALLVVRDFCDPRPLALFV